jgi:hypothetical protein
VDDKGKPKAEPSHKEESHVNLKRKNLYLDND